MPVLNIFCYSCQTFIPNQKITPPLPLWRIKLHLLGLFADEIIASEFTKNKSKSIILKQFNSLLKYILYFFNCQGITIMYKDEPNLF